MIGNIKRKLSRKTLPFYIFITVIAILAIVFTFAQRDKSAEKNIKNIIDLSNSIRDSYKNKNDYWGLNTESVISQNIAAAVENLYNKKVLTGQGFDGALSMPGERSFDIIYKDLNRLQCIRMLTVELQEKDTLGLIKISIKNAGGEADFSWSGENKLPINMKTAKTYCVESNDIMWTFE